MRKSEVAQKCEENVIKISEAIGKKFTLVENLSPDTQPKSNDGYPKPPPGSRSDDVDQQGENLKSMRELLYSKLNAIAEEMLKSGETQILLRQPWSKQ